MLVSEIMNTNVKTIKSVDTIQQAAKTMNKYRIGGLLVLNGKRLVGILTERDIMKKIVATAKDPVKTKVEQVMTKKLIVVDGNTNIEEAAKLMIKYDIKKLPVVQGNGILGMVTSTDILASQPKQIDNLCKMLLFKKNERLVAG